MPDGRYCVHILLSKGWSVQRPLLHYNNKRIRELSVATIGQPKHKVAQTGAQKQVLLKESSPKRVFELKGSERLSEGRPFKSRL